MMRARLPCIILLILLLLNFNGSYGQQLETISRDNRQYLNLSLNNLVILCSMPMSDWERELLSRGFSLKGHNGSEAIYHLGHFSEIFQSASKDPENNSVSLYWYNFLGEERLSGSLQQTITHSFLFERNNYKYYRLLLKGTYYRVRILYDDVIGIEEVVLTVEKTKK